MVLLAMACVLPLFGTRLLNKPKADADAAEVRCSERFNELSKLPNPSAAETAEPETCRFQPGRLDFLERQAPGELRIVAGGLPARPRKDTASNIH